MSEKPMDLRAAAALIWRRRVMVGLFALIGLLCGTAYGVLRPPMPSATALVLLPTPSTTSTNATSTDGLGTQIAIATSSTVLQAAGKSVSPPIEASDLQNHVHVSGVSDNVLAIRVQAPTDARAEDLANAVTSSYIKYVTSDDTTTGAGAVSTLQQQATKLSNQIGSLNTAIGTVTARLSSEGASSAAGRTDTAILASLRSSIDNLSTQLGILDNLLQSQNASGTVTGPPTVLQPASSVAAVSKVRVPMLGAIGLLAGLLVGAVIALVRGRKDRRLRSRDDLATAVGAPVLASFEAKQCKSADDWHSVLEKYRPREIDAWSLRRALGALGVWEPETGVNVSILSFADDREALAAGPEMAAFAASIGVPTALSANDHQAARPLRVACLASNRAARPESLSTFDANDPPIGLDAALSVSVVAVDREEPEAGILPESLRPVSSCPVVGSDPWSSERRGRSPRTSILLAVSAGFADADDLARVALAAVDAEGAIDGILLVNPDSSDSTTGGSPSSAPLTGGLVQISETYDASGGNSMTRVPNGAQVAEGRS